MADNPRQEGLIHHQKQAIAARSSDLVRRGLDSLLRKELRFMSFPENYSLGSLWARSSMTIFGEEDRGNFISEAKGRVSVPKSAILELELNEDGVVNLSTIAELHPYSIQALNFCEFSFDDLDLWFIQGMKGLRELCLRSAKISETATKYISTIPDLIVLDLAFSDIGYEGSPLLLNSKN